MVAIQGYLAQVGITAEVEVANMTRHTMLMRNGWEDGRLVHNASLSEPDTVRNFWVNFSSEAALKGTMLFPEDYQEALTKALAAGDFKTKQKWIWEAQKLLVDKYALVSFFFTQPRLYVIAPKLHNTGIGTTVDAQWTPEAAWMEQ